MESSSARGSTGQLSNSGSTGTGMHHSQSTPIGVDSGARTPPSTPKKGGKMLAIRVQMLDDTVTIFQVQAKAMGRVLFEQVCKQLHLLEADYFGLEYSDTGGTRYWLDLQKPISRQLGLSLVDPLLYFCVKFYTPDPGQLEEEYTRYLFCLQVKRDLANGLMQCNENTAALMASYIVQAECGDFVPEDYPDHTYLSSYKFVPQQDHEMERKIMENHKKHSGQSPAEADLNLLETARRCELYGIKMHPAKDHENVPLNLAVAHMGIIVFQNYTKINTFSWAKIRKISFKRKRFLIKLHPEGYGYYKDTVEFFFEGRNECKNFWKKCVENHGFFRCASVKNVSRHKTRVLSRGSSFRYSGKTQKQIVEFVRDNYVKRQAFQRSASFRHSSAHSSASNMHSTTNTVGNSISAHPLLPLADTNFTAEVSKHSASSIAPVSPTTRSVYRPPATVTYWSTPAPITDNSITTSTTPITSRPTTNTTTTSAVRTTNSPTPFVSSTQPPIQEVPQTKPLCASSPVAVRAAVHRADTQGTTMTNNNNISTITTVRMPSSHKSEGSLHYNRHSPPPDHSPATIPTLFYTAPTINNTNTSMYDNEEAVAPQKRRHIWQRSASCRDLYDFSFEDSGQAKRRAVKTPRPVEKSVSATSSDVRQKLDSPVTIYDDHRAIYSASSRDSSLEIHQDIMMADHQKVYSSSYPGTKSTYSQSQESVEDPGNYDLRDSQDDLSHDSYELIEKSDDDDEDDFGSGDLHTKHSSQKPLLNYRSCSLDSGNYLPSDTTDDSEIDGRKQHKCKSAFDVHEDIFLMEDPRDLPREIVPRKSDGNFYKAFKSGSRTSSQESKSDYYETITSKESLKKRRGSSSPDYEKRKRGDSRTSSMESKSEYYDASSKIVDEVPQQQQANYRHDYDRKINFKRNYGTQPESVRKEARVHSISLQNVETEQEIRSNHRIVEQNTVPRMHKPRDHHHERTTYIWPESIVGIPTEIHDSKQRSTETEDENIFSFDADKIQSMQEQSLQQKSEKNTKQIFVEIEPRKGREPLLLHQPIERTKSDPNSLARQRINSSTRRMLLMHQKSIDLTPAESSDEDYLYKQIPSAPPITKYKGGTHFEMPTAEFGHFDILKREIEGQKTKFEVPKSQFEILGAKTQSDFVNLPPKHDEIRYVLHKRHVMNGTATKEEVARDSEKKKNDETRTESEPPFLFTQNVDLSKIDPITLEVDRSEKPVQLTSPKRGDITHIDPVLLEALSSKLSQIESDSPTSSKTESLRLQQQKTAAALPKAFIKPEIIATKPEAPEKKDIKITAIVKEKIKTDIKPKRVIKPRMQPGKKGKGNKTKVRITSFSSDDESLDSDDVFGTAEATPTHMEFSPPQMRKEMESILKFESERKYLQYTMSSTEVEGSPPTTRKKTDKSLDGNLDPNGQPELRRISERSFSIPSSEDDLNIKTSDLQPVFAEPTTDTLTTVQEMEDGDKSLLDNTLKEDLTLDEEREREKLLLQAEIENDLKDLKVPAKTKITEITSPSMRRKGQSPLLFAHARLNLSEGSAFMLLQKQQATESPIVGRRAKSLDAPIIPVSRLPPLNAFSSKDDTVEEEIVAFELKSVEQEPEKPSEVKEKLEEKKKPAAPSVTVAPAKPLRKERDQIVPEVSGKTQKPVGTKPKIGKKPLPYQRTSSLKDSQKTVSKSPQQAPKAQTKPPKPAPKSLPKNTTPKVISSKVTLENESDVKRTDRAAGVKAPKEKSKSLDKVELKQRVSSKERSKSQDDSDTESKRIEKQQMLYEIAIQQTKIIRSPVKDSLPVFPQVEEMVRERHGKLEISINTIENTNVSLEDAIIITKSPKKLDKKMDKKLTKSLELDLNSDEDNKPMQRLGKSLDLDNRPKEGAEEQRTEFDFKPEAVSKLEEISPDLGSVQEITEAEIHKQEVEQSQDIILEGTSLDVWISVDKSGSPLDDVTVIRKSDDFFEQTASDAKPPDLPQNLESLEPKEETGDKSESSEAQFAAEMQKASSTMSKLLKRKLEKRRLAASTPTQSIVRITSEEESLTEVSDLKPPEIDENFLAVVDAHNKEALLKLSVERSRSEDTGSWMTVECDEFYGTAESFEYEETKSPQPEQPQGPSLLTAVMKHSKLALLKRSSDQSKSSDTTGSWTSGEKDPSPSNAKDTDDSSAMGRTIGFSQTIEKFSSKDSIDKESPEGSEPPKSPRSPRICVLGRAFTIDEESGGCKYQESSSDEAEIPKPSNSIVKHKKSPYPFEEKWATDSELSQKLHKKITKRLSSGDKSLSLDDTKASLFSIEKLSVDSKNSFDTESSSGSLGACARMAKSNDIPKELSSTWKPFTLDSSGSESFDDGLLPPDQDLHQDKQEYFLARDQADFTGRSDVCYKEHTPTRDDTELPEDLANFPANFGYPCITSNIAAMGISSGFLSRTLSRISERSTNSEKSSLEEDSTKASTQSDSLNDESMAFSNAQHSLSSDPPSHAHHSETDKKTPTNDKLSSPPPLLEQTTSNFLANLLQRQISDDRRTSAEMAELSMDDIEIITSERGLKLRRQNSDDTIIDECFEEPLAKNRSSSQESEEWPLPDIPHEKRSLLAMHEMPSSDTSQQTTQVYQPPRIPKTFGLRGSLKSQDSEQWPSPPSSVVVEPVIGNVKTYYVTPAEEACKVTIDSSNVSTYENDSISEKSEDLDDKTHTYENVATEHISESISESLSAGVSGVKIVLLDEHKSGSNSDEDLNISNLNDDVFTESMEGNRNELRPPTVMRRSTTSDDSSHSKRKSSRSSDEESSMATNIDDGTVRYAFKPTKCTHSSHSEDTSIALSLSEWSNSTNTVKFQNLSSSGTKSSSGLKSDDNSLTDIAQSISEWSSSNSKAQFQKLSSSTGDSTTLTERLTEWSSSDSKTFVAQPFLPRLGSSIDDADLAKALPSPKNIPSEDLAQLSCISMGHAEKYYTKSTERPIIIPPTVLSDTEKSSSSVEQKTVHTQRYDKEKQRYLQKHFMPKSSSTDSRTNKIPLKLSKCSPYYSSSLSSESTPLASTSPIPMSKTATVPLTRTHRKPVSKTLFHAKSPPSENDSTSSVESPKSKSDRDRRGYRRRRQQQQQQRRHSTKAEKESKECLGQEEAYYANLSTSSPLLLQYSSAVNVEEEEGYIPDGDSQSGSDIFRMERDEEERYELAEGFDVSSIPPPLLEDDYEEEQQPNL